MGCPWGQLGYDGVLLELGDRQVHDVSRTAGHVQQL